MSLFAGRVSGRTAADVEVAAVAVTFDSSGNLTWVDSLGRSRTVQVHGELAALLEAIFTGTGGAVHRFFK